VGCEVPRQKSISATRFLPSMPPVVFVLSLQYLVLASIVLPLRLLRSISKIPESAKHSTARFAPFSSRHCFCPRCLQHEHLGIPPLNHPQSLRSESKQRSVRPVLHHPLAPFYSSYFPHLPTLSVSYPPVIPLGIYSPLHCLPPRASSPSLTTTPPPLQTPKPSRYG
jgi:hypothetical protein